jgi:hypothetical protein
MDRILGLLVLIVICTLGASRAPFAAARPAAPSQSAEAIVARYYQILNVGLQSGDFSAMASVYAPDAILSRSTPQGDTATLHGLGAIIGYYHRVYLSAPGTRFIRDTWYSLSPTIVLNYEHVINGGQRLSPRCSHLFVLRNDKIQRLFWVVYFAGAR